MNEENIKLPQAAPEVLPDDPDVSSAMLSGIGFYKLTMRRRKQLMRLATIVGAAHILGLIIFGGYVIMTSVRDEPAIFTTPPPVRTYEPRKLEHQVKVQKRQRSSSRPSVVPRIVSTKLSELALPEVKVDPKLVNTTFQPKFKAVSGKGLGAGLGTGYGTAGFGEGISNVDFFGIQARGERIVILVDVSISMIEDERGGIPGFARVKNRVNQVVDALRDGTLFNLAVFADACSVMSPELLHANAESRLKAKNFVRPFNVEGSYGLTSGNYNGSTHGKRAAGGTTRLDLALGAAMDSGCDTILIISDGMPEVDKAITAEMMQAHQARVSEWNRVNASAVESWSSAPAEVQRVWVPPQPARPAVPASKQRIKEGQPLPRDIPAQPAREGYWREVTVRGGGRSRPTPPPPPKAERWTLADFVEHITLIHEAVYKPQGRKLPQIHTIGYMIDKEGHEFLMRLARQYQGQYRRVQSLRK